MFYYARLGDSSILIAFINALNAACECVMMLLMKKVLSLAIPLT